MSNNTDKILNDISLTKETAISLLRIKMGLIPTIGPILNEFFFDLPSRIKQNRINEFVDELDARLKLIEESTIKSEFLQSETFFDLSIQIFESAVKSATKEKRKALAKIYISSFQISSNLLPERASLFTNFVSELEPIQIKILHFIENWNQQMHEVGSYETFHNRFEKNLFLKCDKYEFKYYSGDLERKSLISMGAGLDDYESESGHILLESHRPATVRLTSLGKQFLEYLEL